MNLAETQEKVRKFLVIITIVTFAYYTSKFIFFQSVDFYRSLNPPKLPEPKVAFGILPKLKMREVRISGNPVYKLDTINGALPEFPDREDVYLITKPTTNLLSEQQIKQLATDLGFTGSYVPLSKSEFRWIDGINNRTLTAHAVKKNFSLDTPVSRISTAIFQAPQITNEDAISEVSGFIKSKSLVNSVDINNLKFDAISAQISLGKIKQTNELNPVNKLVKVNVHRTISKTVNGKQTNYIVYGPNPKDSKISFFVTNQGGVFKFPRINFTYWSTDYTLKSDYYLSSVSSVWEAVKQGKGIISYAKGQDEDYFELPNFITANTVEIREVSLAYYEEQEISDEIGFESYLQPIYVFEGIYTFTDLSGQSKRGDIIIYYPAVRGDFVSN